VVEGAVNEGPQVVTRRGVETAIVLSYAEYRKMLLGGQKLSEFFRQSPLAGVDLDLERDRSPARDDVPL
jgi:prevent-host-death family protein